MWTARLRYSGLGILLLILIGASLLAWPRLNHAVFATLAFSVGAFVVLFVVARDGFRQTTVENLMSRGIDPDDRNAPRYDPGLRREWTPMLSSAVSQRMTRKRIRSRAAPPAA